MAKMLNYNLPCPEAVDVPPFASEEEGGGISSRDYEGFFQSASQRERYASIQGSIRHAWRGYKSCVLDQHPFHRQFLGILPYDDLKPVSLTGDSIWVHSAATLYDSLDSLYLAGLDGEYDEAIQLALSLPLPLHPVKTFEYSIRVLGGLLGAYSVSGDARLLGASVRIADALLDGPFRSSPTPLPRSYDVLAPSWRHASVWRFWDWGGLLLHRVYAFVYRVVRDRMGEHRTNSLAGMGTFALEFAYLSKLTGDPRYKGASDKIFRHINEHSNNHDNDESGSITGLAPVVWDVMDGRAVGGDAGLGAGSDSYYEYLAKNAITNQKEPKEVDIAMHESFRKVLLETMVAKNSAHLSVETKRTGEEEEGGGKGRETRIIYPVQRGRNFEHLLCFVPGIVALHEDSFPASRKGSGLELLAEEMLEGCWKTYNTTRTGLGPERALLLPDARNRIDPKIRDSKYYLRPEFVESVFVLQQLRGGDPKYSEMAWSVFQSIEKYCKMDTGYSGLRDVDSLESLGSMDRNRVDSMPSFFIAETLKYLLLTFAPNLHFSLHDFVFTTEAHPLRQLYTLHRNDAEDGYCVGAAGAGRQPIAPVLVVVANILVGFVVHYSVRRFFTKRKTSKGDKKSL